MSVARIQDRTFPLDDFLRSYIIVGQLYANGWRLNL